MADANLNYFPFPVGRCRFSPSTGRAASQAAVFVLVRDLTQDKVLAGIEEFRGKGKVSTSSLSQSDEAVLRQVLEAG